ncbi:hypothetical protein [Rubneribacter badeniensis]|uniref:hypothetical protein n=1 Tax=Rubneribacter badeniensis TaxID=2070688 RepID=UPI003A8EED53
MGILEELGDTKEESPYGLRFVSRTAGKGIGKPEAAFRNDHKHFKRRQSQRCYTLGIVWV